MLEVNYADHHGLTSMVGRFCAPGHGKNINFDSTCLIQKAFYQTCHTRDMLNYFESEFKIYFKIISQIVTFFCIHTKD